MQSPRGGFFKIACGCATILVLRLARESLNDTGAVQSGIVKFVNYLSDDTGAWSGKGASRMHLSKHYISALAHGVHIAAKNVHFRRMLFDAIRLKRIEIERFRGVEEYRFLAYIFLKRSESRSQILQDLWVCYELAEKREGFFVEFGATNGVVNSNTWILEKKLGWKGILAEPNPFWHAELMSNRGCAVDYRCVYSSTGNKVPFMTTDNSDPELSSIVDFSSGDHFADVRARGETIEIETVSLNDLLKDHNAPFEIDYLSIDTEGSEYAILSAFDFSRHVVNLISIEQNKNTEAKIEALLARHGFARVFKEFSQWDGWYVRAELRRRGSRREFEALAAHSGSDAL
jgi:FkbM family methyltransferase